MKHLVLTLAFTVGMASAPALAQETWTVDTSHSAALFSARHMLVANVRGQMGPVKGAVTWDGETIESIEVDVVIDVPGLDTGNDRRDEHLRSADFFDAATYSTMTFKSNRAEAAGEGRFVLVGDLTIRGTTHEVTLDVEGPAPITQVGDTRRTGASATTAVNRFDYGLNWNNLIETGGLVVGEEIKIQIDVELIQRPSDEGSR